MIRVHPSARRICWRTALLLLVLLALPSVAQAIPVYPIDELLGRFNNIQQHWAEVVQLAASRLFWSLALISLTWTMCMMVFRRADFGELFAELVRFIVLTGLFWWLLEQGSVLIQQVLDSMQLLGADASNGDGKLYPSNLLRSGYELFFAVAKHSETGEWKDADKIVAMAMAVIILALVALAAVSLMMITLMTWILGYAGLFLLGFGGARWTSGLAINYYKHVLAVGMSYFVMLLLAGIGNRFLADYSSGVAADITLPNLGIMLVAAIVLLALLVRVPAMVSSLVLGARVGGYGAGGFSGHVMALGGTSIAAGVSHASSGAQALYSAYNAPAAAPAPAPMVSMPAINVPSAPIGPAAAPVPMLAPVISVNHLEGSGQGAPQVTLNTQGMYPPPAGATQTSVFGATPSAQEVARTQAQGAPANAASQAAAAATDPAAPVRPTADTGSEQVTAPSPLSMPAAASITPAAEVHGPSRDVEVLHDGRRGAADSATAGLAANTASLPATPAPLSVSGADVADRNTASAQRGTAAGKPAIVPNTGFSSFASQPLSGSALPPAERGPAANPRSAAQRDASSSSIDGRATGNAPATPAASARAVGERAGTDRGAVAAGTGGRAPAATPSVATAAAGATSSGATSSGATSSGATPSGATPSGATSSAGRDGSRRRHGAAAPPADRAATVSASDRAATSVSSVVPAADKAHRVVASSVPASAGAGGSRGARWWQRVLRLLRWRRDDHAG